MTKEKVLVIVGPTGVGKTALSLKLAQTWQGEIISGDSMQVYRQLDIGTAKATLAERAQAPHHLIDIVDVQARFTAFDFQQQGQALIQAIHQRGHLPMIVGGTGLYLQALLYDMSLGTATQAEANFKSREKWQAYLTHHTPAELWQVLDRIDPVAAVKIPITNSRRVIRALEVYETTGIKFSEQKPNELRYDTYVIGLNCERQLLYERIDQRVDQMMTQGLLAEAKWAYQQQTDSPQAVRGIGYKEFYPYFDGEYDLARAVELVKRNSRHYAKRQLTWFRNQIPVHWYNLVEHPDSDFAQIKQDVQTWLAK